MKNFFKRREKKYLITQEQELYLKELFTQRMKIDQYGEYLVQNLYYDTANWDIIRRSIEKPFYKEKLRLRLYGRLRSDSLGYLELKKKCGGITYKRRITVPLCDLKNRSISEILSSNNSQIHNEIDFFLKGREIREKIFIAFKRTAYTGVQDLDLRLTFDKDILFSLCQRNNNNFINFDPGCGTRIIKPNQLLMEIKTSGAMPLWLTHALSDNSIFPVSFSKYGVCYAKHIIKNNDNLQFAGFMEATNAA